MSSESRTSLQEHMKGGMEGEGGVKGQGKEVRRKTVMCQLSAGRGDENRSGARNAR